MGQSRSDHDDQLPSGTTYHKPVYLKSSPQPIIVKFISASIIVSRSDLQKQREVVFFTTFLSDFIILSEAGGAICYARWVLLCCAAQK